MRKAGEHEKRKSDTMIRDNASLCFVYLAAVFHSIFRRDTIRQYSKREREKERDDVPNVTARVLH